jgi:hypothetical protein
VYPPVVADVRAALARAGLGSRTDAEIERALAWARARCEFYVPQLASGGADAHVQAYARSLCVDLAVYYLREEVEVDDEGDLPLRSQACAGAFGARVIGVGCACAGAVSGVVAGACGCAA